jgi:protein SCO1/2
MTEATFFRLSRGIRNGFRLAALLAIVLLTACHGPKTDSGVRSYPAQGVIQHISADRHVATIQHDAIPGYMAAMTMDFPVRDDHLLDGMTRGDRITFTLDVTTDDSWVTNVQRTGHTDLPAENAAASAAPTLNPGDQLPDAEFVAEDGRHVHLSDFRGKVVVFTFFFTRCPLPNYCPLMNRNFAQARALLLADPHAPDNWQFLSISFDPGFDTPQVLASSADFYRNHNPDRWLFVSATPETLAHFAAPLGLLVMRQANNISHNLRTVDQLANLIRDAAQVPAKP